MQTTVFESVRFYEPTEAIPHNNTVHKYSGAAKPTGSKATGKAS